jgi:hypothetical protein
MSHSGLKTQIWIAVLASISLLSACGGGGGSNDTSPIAAAVPIISASALPVAGMVSGLGSVVVNGVRYETIGANVIDSDDKRTINSPIGIGMIVSLEASNIHASTASTIQIQKGIQGSTSNVNVNQNTLNVAGLPVTVDASTLIFKSNGTLGNLSDLGNSSVEVYGLPQNDGSFKATRIEIESSPSSVQLVGVISQLNTSNATFVLGNGSNFVTISYGTSTPPTGLSNGVVVSIRTNTFLASNQYTATQIYVRATSANVFAEYVTQYTGTSGIRNETNELYGMVSGLTSATSGCSLQVQGLPVTVASATLCSSIQNGDYVEVKGLLNNGTLNAYRIEFRTTGGDRNLTGYHDDENDDDHDNLKYVRLTSTGTPNGSSTPIYTSESSSSYEIYGILSACTAGTCTLTSNGVAITVDISTAIWEHGYVVTSGAVEAKGYMTANQVFKVTKIESKNRGS